MNKYHEVENIRIEHGRISLVVDGKPIEQKLEEASRLLATAKEEELQRFEISPSGYGIHWPLIDEDLSIDALIGIEHKSAKMIRQEVTPSCCLINLHKLSLISRCLGTGACLPFSGLA